MSRLFYSCDFIIAGAGSRRSGAEAAPESKLREQMTTMCLAYQETVTAMVA